MWGKRIFDPNSVTLAGVFIPPGFIDAEKHILRNAQLIKTSPRIIVMRRTHVW